MILGLIIASLAFIWIVQKLPDFDAKKEDTSFSWEPKSREIREILDRYRIHNDFQIDEINSDSATITLMDGCFLTKDRYQVSFAGSKAVDLYEYGTRNTPQISTLQLSADELVAYYQDKLADEIDQLNEIQRRISEEGSVAIFAQALNDNRLLSKREMKALCTALNQDAFLITEADYYTGEIRMTIRY